MVSFREIGYLGRLGNQMFQFASTVGISRKVGAEAKFPFENCFSVQQTGPYDSTLNRNLEVKCDLLKCFDIPGDFFIPARHIKSDYQYTEMNFSFDGRAFEIKDFTSISGYFQTEKYFSHCEEEIRKIFCFNPGVKHEALAFMETMIKAGKEIISVHVRRGDYVNSPNHHPPCELDYYTKSFEIYGNDSIFLIFSDDLDWCKTNFIGNNFIFCSLSNHFSELSCMSLCDHHIIANSSFSWWGAWLNNSTTKKIIAPKKWFGPALPKDTNDIYGPSWIKI